MGESLEVTVRGAQLRVGPAGVATVAPIASFPTRREGDEWVIELGDMVSLQELIVPVRVSFLSHGIRGPLGSAVRLSFSVAGATRSAVSADVVWTIATGPEVGAQARNRRVDHAVAQAYAAVARREAGRLNRDGDFAGARHQLTGVARRIVEYAGDDAELALLAAQAQAGRGRPRGADGSARPKRATWGARARLKSRDAGGGPRGGRTARAALRKPV